MDYLCELPTDAARLEALESLPPNLKSTYERILGRVNQSNVETKRLVRRALRWIANDDGQPWIFDTEALCEAVAIDLGSIKHDRRAIPDQFEILHWCSSLVRQSEDLKKLELAHFTVKEFLQQIDPLESPSIGPYRNEPKNDNIILAKLCLTYLNFENFNTHESFHWKRSEGRFKVHPFRRYAVYRSKLDARDTFDDPEILSLTQKLWSPSRRKNLVLYMYDFLTPWISVTHDVISSGVAEMTALHFAAMHGLTKPCDWLIESGCDVNRNTTFGTPLHCALMGVRAMEGSWVDPLKNTRLRPNETMYNDSANEIVDLLLEAGADSNCSYNAVTGKLSPLFVSLSMCTWNLAIRLLEKGGIVDSSCLNLLENHPRSEEVCRFIEHASNYNVLQENHSRLLLLALESKASNAAHLTAKNKNLPWHPAHFERTLRTAVDCWQVEMVLLLLDDPKLEIDAADENTGLTALHYAAKTDQLRVAQILVARGADSRRSDRRGKTALHHSVSAKGCCCFEFFLHQDQDTSLRDIEGKTVWHLAAQEGNIQALSILLSMHVDPTSFIGLKANDGKTPLLCASVKGCEKAIKLLLSAGSRLTEKASDGSSSLHYAAQSGRLKCVQYLIEEAVDTFAIARDHSNAIHYAISGAIEKTCGELAAIVLVLLENGVDPCQSRSDRCTPLDYLVKTIREKLYKCDGNEIHCLFDAAQPLLSSMMGNPGSASDLRLRPELIYLACSRPFPRAHGFVLSLLNPNVELDVRFSDGKTALMAAAESGDHDIVDALLTHGADPCISDDSGFNALHLACSNGHEDILKLLRKTSIDWNKESTAKIMNGYWRKRVTPLHIAAQSKDSRILEYLLNQGLTLSIDACTDKGETPLSVAVWQSMPKNVSLLLSKKADTTVIDSYGYSAVHWAARRGFEDVISEFINHGANLGLPNGGRLTPELVARKYGHRVLANTIMDYVKLVSSQRQGASRALKIAIDDGNIKLCERLVQSGMDINTRYRWCMGCTPLLHSLHQNQYAISKYLVSQGAIIAGSTCEKLETRGFTAFHYAAASGEAELLRMLLEKTPSEIFLDVDPVHPIHLAVLQENADCVNLILEHISQGKKLHSVMILQCTDVTTVLGKGRSFSRQGGTLQKDLDRTINLPVWEDDFVWYWKGEPFPREFIEARPLHIAARKGNLQLGSMLLAHGASIDSVDGQRATPLHNAAHHNQIAMVKLFLEAGANPNALDWNLQSPVMRAAQQGHVNCVRELLEAGADIQLRDARGQTALHLAVDFRTKDMLIFLMSEMSVYELATEDRWGRSVLYRAMSHPFTFPTSFLLSLSPPAAVYMSQTRSILNAAILNRFAIEVKMLLRRIPACLLPRLLSQREPWRGTPLHVASQNEILDIINLLLETGAQLEIEACEHGTALMGVCATGRLASVKFLVAKGARTSYMHDGQIYSALLAAKYHPEIRRWLLVGRFLEGPKLLAYKEAEQRQWD